MQELGIFQRLWLAVQSFFLILFSARLPAEARPLLPGPVVRTGPKPQPDLSSERSRSQLPTMKAATEEKLIQEGAVRLLILLQREGRLLDFLTENIQSYDNVQIGAAVRDIHRDLQRALREHCKLQPVLQETEASVVTIDPGFNQSAVRLVGEVVGTPPFTGTLRHPGWRVSQIALPSLFAAGEPMLVAPAEVELGPETLHE